MTLVTETKRINADEYFATADDRPRFTQLIDGEVIVNTPTSRHQDLLGFIYLKLVMWAAEAEGRGKVSLSLDLRLGDDHVYAPDLLWFSSAHVPQGDVAYVDGPPDIGVEVRSPSTWRFDIGVKKATYERAGLPELWLVDTQADTVLVFRRSSPTLPTFDIALELAGGEQLTSPLLPDFSLDIAELFDR
jgi:Uma2 family endonuclease